MDASSKDVNARGLPDKNTEVDTPPPFGVHVTDGLNDSCFGKLARRQRCVKATPRQLLGRVCPPVGTG